MKTKERRSGWRAKLYVLSVLVFAVSFIASLAPSIATFAAESIFTVKEATIAELSPNAEGTITSFNDSEIVSEVAFHKLGDSATYKVTLKNNDSADHIIKTISDNNSNANLSYSYDKHENETITGGSNLDFVFTVKYATAVTDISKRAQSSSVKFSIQFADIDATEEITVAPNTGDDFGVNLIIFTISATGLIVCSIVYIKNHKKSAKTLSVVAVLVAAAAIATSVSAATVSSNSFTLIANYGFYDKVVVSYAGNDYIVDYGTKLEDVEEIETPSAVGSTFEGWEDEDGNDLDSTAPITEDITIVAKITTNHYTIAFDKNEDEATGEMSSLTATYNTPITLTNNGFAWDGYVFAGWATAPSGDIVYEDGDEVNNLAIENGVTVTLYAKWERPRLTIRMMGNGRKIGTTDSERNAIKIDSRCHLEPVPVTKYSHTDNINDEGEADGIYGTYLATKDVVKIEGASKLVATIKYGTEANYDYLYIYDGVYDGTVAGSGMTGYRKSLSGNYSRPIETTIEIPGDTATFAFFADSGMSFYGYYATIVGYDSDGNIITRDQSFCDRSVVSGEYKDLADGNYEFRGWSEDQNATVGEYADYDALISHLPGENGDTKTVYAIWEQLYHLTYDGNSDEAEGDMTMVSNDGLAGAEVALYAPNYLRPGYGYIGWSVDKDARPNSNSIIYGPNQILAFEGDLVSKAIDDGQITLYAIWVPKETAYTFQNFNSAAFELTNPGKTITALEDTRDGETYAVAKLADGRWWMIENLRLDPAGKTLDSTNTNNPTAAFSSLVQGRTSSTLNDCDDYYSAACANSYSVSVSNINGTVDSPTADDARWRSYGAQYNWYIATAGNGIYSTSGYATAAGDICSAGWQMPTIFNSANDWSTADITILDLALGGAGFPKGQYNPEPNRAVQELEYPNNYVLGGRTNGAVIGQRGERGNYWSRTSGNDTSSMPYYNVYNYTSYGYLSRGFGINPSGLFKIDAHSVRCMLK